MKHTIERGMPGLPWTTDDFRDLLAIIASHGGSESPLACSYCAGHLRAILTTINARDAMLAALKALVEDCLWTRAGMGYEVESRSGKDIGVAHILSDARAAIAQAEGKVKDG